VYRVIELNKEKKTEMYRGTHRECVYHKLYCEMKYKNDYVYKIEAI